MKLKRNHTQDINLRSNQVEVRMREKKQRTGTTDGSSDSARLDIDAREVKVLGGVGVAGARQLEHAQVPVGAVGRGRG